MVQNIRLVNDLRSLDQKGLLYCNVEHPITSCVTHLAS